MSLMRASCFPDADSQITSREMGTRSCALSSSDIISPTAQAPPFKKAGRGALPCSQPPSALYREGTAHARRLPLQPVEEHSRTRERVSLNYLFEFLTKCRHPEGTEAGAAPFEAVRGAHEQHLIRLRDGLQQGGQLARRVFEVQVNQLDDQVWLALGLHLFKAFEHSHVNRFKRRRISARARRRHQLPVRAPI